MSDSTSGATSQVDEVSAALRAEILPLASVMDQDPDALREAWKWLGRRGWLALRRPMAYGGPEWSEDQFRHFQEEIARVSGALAFLQTQHQSAVSLIAKSSNEALKAAWLPKMADGAIGVGIGFSQLRRKGAPLTRATAREGGFVIEGHVPWVTGWTFFDEFIIGAQLEDGRAVFGLVPFAQAPGLSLSAPMKLAAMQAAQTVTADLEGWWLPDSRVVDIKPPGWILRNDMINITLQGFFAMGCARAGLDVVEGEATRRGSEPIRLAAEALLREWSQCRDQLRAASACGEETTEEKLKLRAWSIDLAVRCAHAAIVATGGAANQAGHPAQRIYREALVFSVSAQTEAIQAATLARLVRSEFGTGTES